MPSNFKKLNDNWEVEGAKEIYGRMDLSHSEKEKLNRIKEFYFGSEEISMKNLQGLINMFTDVTSWVPAHRITTLVSSHSKSPVYEYMFSYVSEKFSYAQMQGASPPWLGVCLADELHYLFQPHLPSIGDPLAGNDFAIRDLMLDFWVSFATSVRPGLHFGTISSQNLLATATTP